MRVQKFTDWQAAHPDTVVDGNSAGKWLVYKPCLNTGRRFASYFAAHQFATYRDICRCREAHFIIELAEPPQPQGLSRSYRRMVESA